MVLTTKVPMLKPGEYELWRMRMEQYIQMVDYSLWELEIHGESISQENLNQKFLRSLSPEWNTHTIMWRNKPEIDTLSLDDLYNNLKIYEPENTGRKLTVNGTETIGFDKSKNVPVDTTNFQCFENLSELAIEEFVNEPIVSEPVVKKPVVETSEAKASAEKPKAVKKNNGAPIIEDWVSDSEEEDMPQAKIQKKIVKPSFATIEFVKSKEEVKSPRKTVNHGNPQQDLQEKGVIDSRCSRHMTGNMSYLTDFEEIDGGYVAFGGNPKRGKITGRATSDESKLWNRRLGHINFKTMNKLVKGNLVRGLPSKLFENDQTCVACQKGKQHRASSTNDETSGILKSFITGVENLIDQKVKVIRCDNGTEFKNKEMNQFCKRKDHIGKFDGKADEGFFVGYSINSKAFRVFNSRTRIVEENLHVQFSENTHNIARSRPNWLFDIDALTKSMNYKPVVAGKQFNGNACTKACDDAGKARMETVPGKDYILLPLFKPLGDNEKKVTEEPRKECGNSSNDQEKEDNVNNTNNTNAASTNEVNVVGAKTSIELLDDPNKPELEDIVYSDDDEDVGAKADMNNLNTFMPVSPIPTTRIHKDHPVKLIIKDLNSAPQTRRMIKNLEEHSLFSSVQQRTNHKDFQNYLFSCFLSQEELKKVIHALKDPSWIEAYGLSFSLDLVD
ncbi:uncharacterized mitochondrial protein-like protein [Tanacetum coccineum]|uniref:Uncharacterized mitochondrial protein-like protein n=1 Tax=Tanacetum coccineum TaxID=301880 RepID=A0ABQ4XF04_9ASTR